MTETPVMRRGALSPPTGSGAAHSGPTGGPARRGRRGRRGAQHVRPCAARRNSDRSLALCRRTRRVARFGSRHTGAVRSRRRGIHTAETPGTRPRRTGATRRRPEAGRTRSETSRNGRARPCTGPTRSGLAGCTRLGAHRHHRAGTVPTNPQRGVAAAAGSGVNGWRICVPTGRVETEESRVSVRLTQRRGHRAAGLPLGGATLGGGDTRQPATPGSPDPPRVWR